ncbi:MAG TPA: tetratricopeptide repeat protein [Burkholderiales bacterium]
MTLLLVLGALIAGATVWFLARAVARTPAADGEARESLFQVRDRLLAQLRELDAEEADRNVDAAVAADERRRLEAELAQVLKAIEAGDGKVTTSSRPPRQTWAVTLIVLALALPLASAALYLGAQGSVLAQLQQAQALARGGVPSMVHEMVARLERRLAEQPNDPHGWAQLGRAYAVLGRVEAAEQAYARAYEQAPGDVDVVAGYASFLLARDSPRVSDQAVAMFEKLQALEPAHPSALWGLGLAAYQERRYADAAKLWERLLEQLPPGSEIEPQVRRAVESARTEAARAK